MKQFNVYKLALDGSRKPNGPHFAYKDEDAHSHQPEWGKLEEIKPFNLCSDEEKSGALEVIEEVVPGYTIPAGKNQFDQDIAEVVVPDSIFKRCRIRQLYEVETIDLEDVQTDAGFAYQEAKALAERKKRYKSAEEVIDIILDKGINSQELQAYKDARTAIKAQYPKPVKG